MSDPAPSPRVEVAVLAALPELLADPATVVAFGVRPGSGGPRPARGSDALAALAGVDVGATARTEHAGTAAGDLTTVPIRLAPAGTPGPARTTGAGGGPGARVLLVGIGTGSATELRRAAATLTRSLKHCQTLVTTLGAGPAGIAGAVTEGVLLGAYRAPRQGRTPRVPEGSQLERVLLAGVADGEPAREAVEQGVIAARATTVARDLANTRSSTKTPAWLVAEAERLAKDTGLTGRVWDVPDLQREGFRSILAVGGGSASGPRLVRLDYTPAGADARHRAPVVLVGKGITFDTGGISLKPREAMLGMTTDMTGAGVVLAVLAACRSAGVQVSVTGLLPLAENAFGGGSYRPGDIVTTYDGTTVEVRNTDAEGRLVLADALGYARTRLRPRVMVDVATLTGAATMALGRSQGALYANDPALTRALVSAGEAAGEPLWPMPLVEDYRPLIDSELADVGQISTRPSGGAGSVIAALFLREFVGDVAWAHLDIAGPGRAERDHGEISRGGTGWGARVLLRWLRSLQLSA